jgi:hypothetical protein
MKIPMMFAALAIFPAGAAFAQDCTAFTKESSFDLDEAEILALYDCLGEQMATGYAAEGDPVGSDFRNWTVTSTRPAVAGAHGERLLQTFANDIAAPQYLQFAEEDFTMPVGSILAKESITLSTKNQAARPGPLFVMTKLEAGASPETGDWLYAGVQPNGKEMGIKQSFCHDCHVAYDYRDMLAYPLEEVRVSQ